MIAEFIFRSELLIEFKLLLHFIPTGSENVFNVAQTDSNLDDPLHEIDNSNVLYNP